MLHPTVQATSARGGPPPLYQLNPVVVPQPIHLTAVAGEGLQLALHGFLGEFQV